jgi:hypothetical protein
MADRTTTAAPKRTKRKGDGMCRNGDPFRLYAIDPQKLLDDIVRLEAEVAGLTQERDMLAHRVDELSGEKERAIEWAVRLENETRRLESQ